MTERSKRIRKRKQNERKRRSRLKIKEKVDTEVTVKKNSKRKKKNCYNQNTRLAKANKDLDLRLKAIRQRFRRLKLLKSSNNCDQSPKSEVNQFLANKETTQEDVRANLVRRQNLFVIYVISI